MTMASFHVTVSDSVFPNLDPARQVLATIGAELRMADTPTPEGIVAAAAASDALLVTYAKISADMIKKMPKCRVISRFGIGVDNVDIEAATASSIVVTKVPDYCIDEVSDHAMALLLAVVRKIPSSSARTHGGRWEMKAVVPIHRLRGSVLGLAGFGRIPQLVVPKAQAFGMKVVAYDPFIPADVFAKAGVEKVDLPALLATSDYISVHTPLTPETKNLFNRETFGQMKRGAYIVNTARGPIIDETALAEALDSGQIAGAALDVMTQEPPPSSPLFGRDNVIITPHTSFYSEESLVELQVKAAQEVVAVLSGRSPRNPVNPEAIAHR
jgi:D-3-phosphoglycerate dehydrogenase / 2-oxoglutarate reductase